MTAEPPLPAKAIARACIRLVRIRFAVLTSGVAPLVRALALLEPPRKKREHVLTPHQHVAVVESAAALFPGRARCLEQSICLIEQLREDGYRGELKIGIRAKPFVSHAWVELNDLPLNEHASVTRELTLLAPVTP